MHAKVKTSKKPQVDPFIITEAEKQIYTQEKTSKFEIIN
jgi:hypothetical protein